MKPGKTVVHVRRGRERAALVVGVPGSGPSGWKTLDLDVAGEVLKDVPHETDAGRGGFWREHAAPADATEAEVPPSVVPEPTGAGRATAGAGSQGEDEDG
jgi:hypothetical protein